MRELSDDMAEGDGTRAGYCLATGPEGRQGVGRAPGRLDFFGGVSDYSGATVLQAAIALETVVTVARIKGKARTSSDGDGDDLGEKVLACFSKQFGKEEVDLIQIECEGEPIAGNRTD